jgi:FeS assembly SUF system regulator
MLRISKMTDYAVVLATHLAAADGAHAARDLALQTQIPEPTASKVLKKLARAGVVISQRGAKGGYALARRPEQIGIHEVIEAIEGPIAVTECSDESTDSFCEY